MPAEPVPVASPKHPLPALTSYELRDYRRDPRSAATLRRRPGHHGPDLGHVSPELGQCALERQRRLRGRAQAGARRTGAEFRAPALPAATG